MFECNLPLSPADYVLPVYKIDGWTAIKRLISGNVGEILVLHVHVTALEMLQTICSTVVCI